MKTLNVTFTDAEYIRLSKARQMIKGFSSWEKFILAQCCRKLPRVRGGQ